LANFALALLLSFAAIGLSLGGSSLYSSTDKIHKRNNTKNNKCKYTITKTTTQLPKQPHNYQNNHTITETPIQLQKTTTHLPKQQHNIKTTTDLPKQQHNYQNNHTVTKTTHNYQKQPDN
jgi:hypothetical protein